MKIIDAYQKIVSGAKDLAIIQSSLSASSPTTESSVASPSLIDMEPSLLDPVFPLSSLPTANSIPVKEVKSTYTTPDAFLVDPFASSPSAFDTHVSSTSIGLPASISTTDPFDELLSIASRPQTNVTSISAQSISSVSVPAPASSASYPAPSPYTAQPSMMPMNPAVSHVPVTQSFSAPFSLPNQGHMGSGPSGVNFQQPIRESVGTAGNNTSSTAAPVAAKKKEEINPFDLF